MKSISNDIKRVVSKTINTETVDNVSEDVLDNLGIMFSDRMVWVEVWHKACVEYLKDGTWRI